MFYEIKITSGKYVTNNISIDLENISPTLITYPELFHIHKEDMRIEKEYFNVPLYNRSQTIYLSQGSSVTIQTSETDSAIYYRFLSLPGCEITVSPDPLEEDDPMSKPFVITVSGNSDLIQCDRKADEILEAYNTDPKNIVIVVNIKTSFKEETMIIRDVLFVTTELESSGKFTLSGSSQSSIRGIPGKPTILRLENRTVELFANINNNGVGVNWEIQCLDNDIQTKTVTLGSWDSIPY